LDGAFDWRDSRENMKHHRKEKKDGRGETDATYSNTPTRC
jgi:hypothetical protein